MKRKLNQGLIKGLIHLVVWYVAYYLLVNKSQPPSSAAVNEAMPWLIVLYLGYVFKIGLESLGPLAFYYLILLVIANNLEWSFIYHDMPEIFSIHFVIFFFLSYVFLASPIFVNLILKRMRFSRLFKGDKKKSEGKHD